MEEQWIQNIGYFSHWTSEYVFTKPLYKGQDMIQGQFFSSWDTAGLRGGLLVNRLALPRLKTPVYTTIYPYQEVNATVSYFHGLLILFLVE